MSRKLAAASSNVNNETIQHHIRCCSDAKEAVSEAATELKKRLKAASADGVNRKMLVVVLKDRDTDPEKLRTDMRDRIHMLALINIPIIQAELFDITVSVSEEAAVEQSVWQADGEGYAAGVTGGDREANQHAPGTELYGAWDTGYLRGQAKIARGMKKGAKVASTRRKRASNGEIGLPM